MVSKLEDIDALYVYFIFKLFITKQEKDSCDLQIIAFHLKNVYNSISLIAELVKPASFHITHYLK